jgi:Family of unknown function (DUF7002)
MSVEQLVRRYPRLYHMAESGSWQSVREHGLLSTSALLDLFEYRGRRRDAIESQHRPVSVEITHPRYGSAVIRDQKPMSDGALRRCLQGMTPQEWYRVLNSYVFFWLTPERLSTLLNAGSYKDEAHCVLELDTQSLVARHHRSILLSPMNSGCTRPFAHPRGRDTFKPIAEFPFDQRRNRGSNAVVELAVQYSVPDVRDFVVDVKQMKGDVVLTTEAV